MRFDHPIYAFRNGNIVGIDDDNVVSGLACNCICPQCGGRLVAKKGQKVIHHFAHHVKQDCTYGYQTSLHLLAKEILDEADEIYVPDISVKYEIILQSYICFIFKIYNFIICCIKNSLVSN